jgi:hypothetical protein
MELREFSAVAFAARGDLGVLVKQLRKDIA